jgi:Matrixin
MKALRVMSFAIPIILAALLMIVVRPVYPFVPEATGTGPNAYTVDAWPAGAQPINWLINPTRSSAITGSTSVTTVIQAAFATWTTAPDTNLSVISSPGTSTITDANNVPNGTNLVCFVCTGVDFSASDGTLALTTTFSNGSGVISQADIYFNPNPQNNVRFVTDPQATPCSTSSPQDLQTVATHEIGHFFGLDHSGIARAIMYPFAPCILTTLSYDDLAGISTSYPSPAPVVPIGKITGTVSLAPNGSPVFAAHVFANSTTANNPFAAFNNIRKTPIGTLTLPNGSFTISGVPADSYVVMAEPLDGPVDKTAVEWGSPTTFNQQIQTNFTTRWH